MMTYLMHVETYKHAELKIKKFDQEDEWKGVWFILKSEWAQGKKARRSSKDNKDEESTRKRKIAQDEEKEVDYEIIDRKYPIKEWKTECLGAKPQTDQAEHLEEINLNMVIRSNGQKRYFSTLMTVLSIFNREDLNAVYQLVMDKYQDEDALKFFNRFLSAKCLMKQRFQKELSKKHRVHKEYYPKQGGSYCKRRIISSRDPLLMKMPEDKVDHMETENAQSEGRTREMMDGRQGD
ncbi:hypothetical protein Tco_0968498 [Tanacetum coccineum]